MDSIKRPKLIAIVGATASGKTALAEQLALACGGEIVSADALQVYRGMDIGTAKDLTLKVPQHCIDLLDPGQKMTVALFQDHAYGAIGKILERNKAPFLTGGSMLYASAVLDGYSFDVQRANSPRYDSLVLGIEMERAVLKERVRTRTERWIEMGIIEEISRLYAGGVLRQWLERYGMEYRYFSQYIHGECSLEEAKEKTNTAIFQYIKRQYTWWRHHGEVHWIQGYDQALSMVEVFLSKGRVV